MVKSCYLCLSFQFVACFMICLTRFFSWVSLLNVNLYFKLNSACNIFHESCNQGFSRFFHELSTLLNLDNLDCTSALISL